MVRRRAARGGAAGSCTTTSGSTAPATPTGWPATRIPLESRIILVADAFEAITADRPYRQHRTVDEAIAELRRAPGTQFDARCVAALERAIGHRGLLAA